MCLYPCLMVSDVCNLRCGYCYYRHQVVQNEKMNDQVLEIVIHRIMEASRDMAFFCWHGGEPLIVGLDFYQKVVALQNQLRASGQQIINSIQTNGTLIDKEWAKFFYLHDFQVGLSLDGPGEYHDLYRVDRNGRGTFARVMQGVEYLRREKIEPGILAVLHAGNVSNPERIFRFFVDNGFRYFDFKPCYERDPAGNVEPFSITPEVYAEFMTTLFDLWLAENNPEITILNLEDAVAAIMGKQPSSCQYRAICQHMVTMSPDGYLEVCECFPKEALREPLQKKTVKEIIDSEAYRDYLYEIERAMEICKGCKWLYACGGGCPKYSLLSGGDWHRNLFCQARQRVFRHIKDHIDSIAGRI